MAVDGAALLGETGHVEHGAALLFEMRRHPEERADRDDTGSADAGDEDAVRLIESGMSGLGQRGQPVHMPDRRLCASLSAPPMHGDKARTETLDARIVLVATRLIDRPFAAELGFDRHD